MEHIAAWEQLVVYGSMLEVVRPFLELLGVLWAFGRDSNNSSPNPDTGPIQALSWSFTSTCT